MITVRRAELEDSKGINGVSSALGYDTISTGVARKWLGALLASEEHRVWVCEVEGEIVAWLHALISYRLASAPFVEIAGLVVSTNHRRQGVGRNLVNQAVEWGVSQGLKVRVRCSSERQQAHQFYESLGFTDVKSQLVFDYYG